MDVDDRKMEGSEEEGSGHELGRSSSSLGPAVAVACVPQRVWALLAASSRSGGKGIPHIGVFEGGNANC